MTKIVRTVPPLPQTERGSFCIISTDKPGERLLYTNGSNVLWRNMAPLAAGSEKPDDLFCWKGHAKRVSVAAMSPNSQWVVSGDVTGAIRIWGAKGDHVQKNEFKLWDGIIKDASWSGDSTRIVACGDGKEIRACAMIWDTGSKTGEIAGHAKQINSISFRNQRPFRVVTGGEDNTVIFHQGPPFKFVKSHDAHGNFVNCVRYSPDGAWVVSAGSDSKLVLYEGKDGGLEKEFEKPEGIAGSLWAVAWSPDGARVVTAGGDKKLRVWDREAGAQVAEALIGEGALEDMQVGVTWPTAGRIVSVCLDGRLLIWDVADSGAPTLVFTVDGTQGILNAVGFDKTTGIIVQGGTDGFVAMHPPSGQVRKAKIGKGINHIVMHSHSYTGGAGEAWVFSLDNCARLFALEMGEAGKAFDVKELVVGANWMDTQETKLIAATSKNSLLCLGADGVAWSKADAFARQPTALGSSPQAGQLAVAIDRPDTTVGGVQSSEFDIQVFSMSDTSSPDGITLRTTLQGHLKEVTVLKYSPSGEFLASADAGNKIFLWTLASDGAASLTINNWSSHTARINSLDWLPGGRKLVSGGLDRHLYVWDVDSPAKRLQVVEAHKGGCNGLAAVGEKSFASVGYDGFLQVHETE